MYSGKTFDTFEPAMNQMLNFYGLPMFAHMDCAALRCFGFSADPSLKKWFRPRVSLPIAVAALSEAIGISLSCRALSPAEIGKKLLGYCGVIGPLEKGIAAPDIRQYYFNGDGRFLTVQSLPDETFAVYDPIGIPDIILDLPELMQLLKEGAFYIAPVLNVRSTDISTGNTMSKPEILRRGLKFHEKIRAMEAADLSRVSAAYRPGRHNGVALSYCVINLALQLDKVFLLANSCAVPPGQLKVSYFMQKQELYRSAERENAFGIVDALRQLWEILNEYGAYLGVFETE